MSDSGVPNKRRYSAITNDISADDEGNVNTLARSRTYGTKAKPKGNLPAFKPLTITRTQEVPHSEGYEDYGWDVGYDEALMIDYVMNDSSGVQAEGMTGEVENAGLKGGQFNTASQGLEDADFDQGEDQSKILVEEEGLLGWDGGGDYTPSESNQEGEQDAEYEEVIHHPVHGNIPDLRDEYFTAREISSELGSRGLFGDAPFVGLNDIRQPPHQDTVEERFDTPSDVVLVYGDESPEEFDPNLPCSVSSDIGDKVLGYTAGQSDEYDVFGDDDLWKEVAKKEFYIPPNSDPPSIEQLVEGIEENSMERTYMEEPKLDSCIAPFDIDLEPHKSKAVEAGTSVSNASEKRHRGKFNVPLPQTLISPISHMSNPNPQPPPSLSAKRVLVFTSNSRKLARMTESLAILQSLDEDGPKPPEPEVEGNSEITKWAHLPPEERQKPFLRPPLPKPVNERSPIEGLNTKTVVRVCFRVGEAIRFTNIAGTSAGGGEAEILTELFARVTFSERIGIKQNIQFGDIYHDHPPFLSGSYNLFRACPLWDQDSANLLGEEGKGKMVRVVGKMKKARVGVQEGMNGYFIEVLSVWECGWEEVERARGVVCGW